MVSDQEIASCVESLLRQPDSAAAGGGVGVGGASSASDVVRQVEAKFGGVDLSHKADFIQDQIDLLRGPPPKDHRPPPPAGVPAPTSLHPGQLQPQFLLHPIYQISPGAYPFAFRFPPPMPPGPAPPGASAVQYPYPLQPQQLQMQPQQQQQLQPQQQQQLQEVHAAAVQQPVAGAASRASAASATGRIKRRRGPGGLTRVCGVSPELQVIVGEPAMPRTEIVKQLWAYIRKNNLQDPNNKRKIICNDELRLVLETDCTDIFKMNKLLAKHITPLEPTKDAGQDSKRLKADDVAESEPDAGPGPCTLAISDALAEFLGTGETELLQSEALIRIWDYIKDNHLEDPVNSMISCDSKLQQLFGCESFTTSGVSEMLACHLFEKS